MSKHPCVFYDCPDCGRYATNHAGTLIWPMALDSDRRAQIEAIRRENAAGRRPTISGIAGALDGRRNYREQHTRPTEPVSGVSAVSAVSVASAV